MKILLDPRDRLQQLADARGESLAELSRMLRRRDGYLACYVREGHPERLTDHDLLMANHPNRGRGAPAKAKGEHHPRFNISLPPDIADKLDRMPGGRSENIARLVREAPEPVDE